MEREREGEREREREREREKEKGEGERERERGNPWAGSHGYHLLHLLFTSLIYLRVSLSYLLWLGLHCQVTSN